MSTQASDPCPPVACGPVDAEPAASSHGARRLAAWLLGGLAVLVLAAALCARPLLNEDRTVPVEQLLSGPEGASSASLMVRHTMHLLAAGGLVLAACSAALSGRRWRLCGLEIAALLMIGAALLSLPVASDKRLALNSTIDRILPLVIAAALYQLLVWRPTWRRVLLAGVVAAAVANCARASAKWWEYRQQWNEYQQQKVDYWSQRNVSLDDPRVSRHEAFLRGRRPISFIQGPNVTGSFILLGLVATGAAALGCGWRRAKCRPDEPAAGEPTVAESPPESPPQPELPVELAAEPVAESAACDLPASQASDIDAGEGPAGVSANSVDPTGSTPRSSRDARVATRWLLIPAAVLVLLALWHLVVLGWIQTAGTKVALMAALAAGAVSLWLRDRPWRLAAILVAGLVLLQGTLVVLALSSTELRREFLNYAGAGGNIKTLGQRLFIYESAIQLFREYPITGVGPAQFGKHYLAVKPSYVGSELSHAHNWLLNAAASRGILGVLGMLVALGGSGWVILRALARAPDRSARPRWAAVLPTVLLIAACWLIVMSDMPRSLWPKVLPLPVAASFVAGILASLCGLSGRLGHVVLLAGVVGFVVHCTVEITPSVPSVMWPFWGVVAVAMAWNGRPRPLYRRPRRISIGRIVPLLAVAAAVLVAALTVRPMRAVALMHQAQRAAMQEDFDAAVTLLRRAADADPLDPLPLKAAAFVRYKMAAADQARAAEHYREYAELSRAAVDRNPQDYAYWRSLGLANMLLGVTTEDFGLVEEAIGSMQRALELNPRWPVGWLELARMAAVQGRQPDRPDLLWIAIDAVDQALVLEETRPREVPPALKENERAELLAMRRHLDRRLRIAEARAAATRTAR